MRVLWLGSMCGSSCGEPIAQRWSPAVKRGIRDSRCRVPASGRAGTASGMGDCLCVRHQLLWHACPPWRSEDAPLGDGFLASVCKDWEAELEPLRLPPRAVCLRTVWC